MDSEEPRLALICKIHHRMLFGLGGCRPCLSFSFRPSSVFYWPGLFCVQLLKVAINELKVIAPIGWTALSSCLCIAKRCQNCLHDFAYRVGPVTVLISPSWSFELEVGDCFCLINSLTFYIICIPLVPALGGAEVALGLYYKILSCKTFFIYGTCVRRAPARPMRARLLQKWCAVPNVTLEAADFTLHSSHSTLHTPHFTPCTDAFTQRSLYTEKLLLTASFYRQPAFTCFYRSLYAEKLLHTEAFTQRTRRPQPDLGAKAKKYDFDFEALCKGNLKGKSSATKLRKSADESPSQPSCSQPDTIYNAQLQKTTVARTQPQHQGTLLQPSQCDLQRLS